MLAAWLRDDLTLLAATTVAGNVDLTTATENTRAVLGLIGRADVPVAAGADRPLVRPLRIAPAGIRILADHAVHLLGLNQIILSLHGIRPQFEGVLEVLSSLVVLLIVQVAQALPEGKLILLLLLRL